jgi:hypothetical protein
MNIELEYIKKSLAVFRSSESPYLNLKNFIIEMGLDFSNSDDLKKTFHYLSILKDQGLISGVNLKPEQEESLGFSFAGNGRIIIPNLSIMLRLTNDGHKVYETLLQSKFWDASKKQFKELGSESLKIIPSLVIEYIKTLI